MRKFLAFLIDLPAWFVIFLPYAVSTSPWEAAPDTHLRYIALPFFLPLAFGLCRIRLLWSRKPNWGWIIPMYLVNGWSLLLALELLLSLDGLHPIEIVWFYTPYTIALCVALTATVLVLRRRGPSYLGAFLLGRALYLANASFCLSVFWRAMQPGVRFSILASVIYLADFAWLFYRGWTYQDRIRSRVGLCRVCGYDLRASPVRCPECGTPVPAPRTPQVTPI